MSAKSAVQLIKLFPRASEEERSTVLSLLGVKGLPTKKVLKELPGLGPALKMLEAQRGPARQFPKNVLNTAAYWEQRISTLEVQLPNTLVDIARHVTAVENLSKTDCVIDLDPQLGKWNLYSVLGGKFLVFDKDICLLCGIKKEEFKEIVRGGKILALKIEKFRAAARHPRDTELREIVLNIVTKVAPDKAEPRLLRLFQDTNHTFDQMILLDALEHWRKLNITSA